MGPLGPTLRRVHKPTVCRLTSTSGLRQTPKGGSYDRLSGGRSTAWERLAKGVRPPHGPPLYTYRGYSFLVGFTGKFANILVGFTSKLITLFVIFFHAIISHDYRFFLEAPPFEESQDPDSSPRREEVGRRTLRDYGGFLPSFFYRARFQLFHFLVFVEKLQKLSLRSL